MKANIIKFTNSNEQKYKFLKYNEFVDNIRNSIESILSWKYKIIFEWFSEDEEWNIFPILSSIEKDNKYLIFFRFFEDVIFSKKNTTILDKSDELELAICISEDFNLENHCDDLKMFYQKNWYIWEKNHALLKDVIKNYISLILIEKDFKFWDDKYIEKFSSEIATLLAKKENIEKNIGKIFKRKLAKKWLYIDSKKIETDLIPKIYLDWIEDIFLWEKDLKEIAEIKSILENINALKPDIIIKILDWFDKKITLFLENTKTKITKNDKIDGVELNKIIENLAEQIFGKIENEQILLEKAINWGDLKIKFLEKEKEKSLIDDEKTKEFEKQINICLEFIEILKQYKTRLSEYLENEKYIPKWTDVLSFEKSRLKMFFSSGKKMILPKDRETLEIKELLKNWKLQKEDLKILQFDISSKLSFNSDDFQILKEWDKIKIITKKEWHLNFKVIDWKIRINIWFKEILIIDADYTAKSEHIKVWQINQKTLAKRKEISVKIVAWNLLAKNSHVHKSLDWSVIITDILDTFDPSKIEFSIISWIVKVKKWKVKNARSIIFFWEENFSIETEIIDRHWYAKNLEIANLRWNSKEKNHSELNKTKKNEETGVIRITEESISDNYSSFIFNKANIKELYWDKNIFFPIWEGVCELINKKIRIFEHIFLDTKWDWIGNKPAFLDKEIISQAKIKQQALLKLKEQLKKELDFYESYTKNTENEKKEASEITIFINEAEKYIKNEITTKFDLYLEILKSLERANLNDLKQKQTYLKNYMKREKIESSFLNEFFVENSKNLIEFLRNAFIDENYKKTDFDRNGDFDVVFKKENLFNALLNFYIEKYSWPITNNKSLSENTETLRTKLLKRFAQSRIDFCKTEIKELDKSLSFSLEIERNLSENLFITALWINFSKLAENNLFWWKENLAQINDNDKKWIDTIKLQKWFWIKLSFDWNNISLTYERNIEKEIIDKIRTEVMALVRNLKLWDKIKKDKKTSELEKFIFEKKNFYVKNIKTIEKLDDFLKQSEIPWINETKLREALWIKKWLLWSLFW